MLRGAAHQGYTKLQMEPAYANQPRQATLTFVRYRKEFRGTCTGFTTGSGKDQNHFPAVTHKNIFFLYFLSLSVILLQK